jgi:hypothetical protein
MKKELGDHIGKKRGWLLWELGELAILAIKKLMAKKKKIKPEFQTMNGELCGGLPKPTYRLGENGDWQCIGQVWKWVDDIGYGG